jgi:nucleoid DNA-binding protein
MRATKWGAVVILVAATGLVLGQAPPTAERKAEPKESPPPQPLRLGTVPAVANSLTGRIAQTTKLQESEVAKVVNAMGPAVRDLLGRGQNVDVPNLGTFRVVRIPEHRDLVNGRPATIAGSNFVEFLAADKFAEAANQSGVRPADTVPPFEYNVLPDQTPGLRTGNTRMPNRRTP